MLRELPLKYSLGNQLRNSTYVETIACSDVQAWIPLVAGLRHRFTRDQMTTPFSTSLTQLQHHSSNQVNKSAKKRNFLRVFLLVQQMMMQVQGPDLAPKTVICRPYSSSLRALIFLKTVPWSNQISWILPSLTLGQRFLSFWRRGTWQIRTAES